MSTDQPVRLRDVADLAGVSVKTVSNVVHGHPAVSPGMRSKVQDAIEHLGYQPNISARSLRTGRTGLIGLSVPRISDPYFTELAAVIIDVAAEHGLSVLLEQTAGDAAREAEALHGRRPTLIDGLILSPIALSQQVLDDASPAIPVVLLGEHLLASTRSRVAVDNVAASREAVTHLLGLGRRRIAAIGAKRGSTAATATQRLLGYHEALERAGVADDPALEVPVANFTWEEGHAAVARLVASGTPVDALFCFNDQMALGGMAALREAGRTVPDDIAVVGFDGVVDSSRSRPGLSTVAPDLDLLARAAVGRLAARLADATVPEGHSEVVPHTLVVRGSSDPERAREEEAAARAVPIP